MPGGPQQAASTQLAACSRRWIRYDRAAPDPPGQIYLVTCRCTQRQYLPRPDKTTTRLILYTLGEAATRFGIELIAWYTAGNYDHAIVYDPSGNLPLFLERFHKLCARAFNARWERWENFWAAEATCAVRLIEDADVLDKVVYVLANPVTDHLVERVFDWPGASSLRYTGAGPRTIIIERPAIFFRECGPMPTSPASTAAGTEITRSERASKAYGRGRPDLPRRKRPLDGEPLSTGGRIRD